MIAPTPTNFEIGRRVAFFVEAASPRQRDGRHVLGLDVRLKPVKAQAGECITNDCPEPLSHKDVTFVASKREVPDVAALKYAVDDVSNVDCTDQLSISWRYNNEAIAGWWREA